MTYLQSNQYDDSKVDYKQRGEGLSEASLGSRRISPGIRLEKRKCPIQVHNKKCDARDDNKRRRTTFEQSEPGGPRVAKKKLVGLDRIDAL
jgi:hypothetical protein